MAINIDLSLFEWDNTKNKTNIDKHGISFPDAITVFLDPCRIIAIDDSHSNKEKRYFCIGQTESGIITVRFTRRDKIIRIIGAGFWRKGRKLYEEENKIYR